MPSKVQKLINKIELEQFADNLSQTYYDKTEMTEPELRRDLRDIVDDDKVKGSVIDSSVQKGITKQDKNQLMKQLLDFVKTKVKEFNSKKCNTVEEADKEVCNELNKNSSIKSVIGDVTFDNNNINNKESVKKLKSKQKSGGLRPSWLYV